MRAYLIENGKVKNIIAVNDFNVFPGLLDPAVVGPAKVGDLCDGMSITPVPPVIVPPTQAELDKQALLDHLTTMEADGTLPVRIRAFATKLSKVL